MTRSNLIARISAFLVITTTILWIKQLGGFERFDLLVFDFLYRLTPGENGDERIAIVGITEKDIRSADSYPFSDRYLAKIIQKIEAYSPAAIGLDLIRDVPVPPVSEEFYELLQSNRLVAAGTIGVGNEAISFPPMAKNRGDVTGLEDLDGVVRRAFLFASSEKPVENFALALALIYLESQDVIPAAVPEGWLQLNNTVFYPLRKNDGGYATSDMGGYQLLVRWRKNDAPFPIIPVSAILDGQVDPEILSDKIVIIGPNAPSLKDTFRTSLVRSPEHVNGVEIHAHVLSQILSAVLDERPLLRAVPFPVQVAVFIAFALLTTGLLALPQPSSSLPRLWIEQAKVTVFCALSPFLLVGYLFFFAHYWLPLSTYLIFLLISASLGFLSKFYAYHVESLQSEIKRVSDELTHANQLVLEKLLDEAALQIVDALMLEIGPILRDLSLQIDIARASDEYSPRWLALESGIERIKNLIDYVLPSLTGKDSLFKVENYQKWLEEVLRIAIAHRSQYSILIEKVGMTVRCAPALANLSLTLPKCLSVIVFVFLDNSFDACLEKMRVSDGNTEMMLNVGIYSDLIDNQLVISVEDNGKPIPAETVANIFQPFASDKGSFGMGLYLSRKLVQQQNGTITYCNLGESKVFSLKIPI